MSVDRKRARTMRPGRALMGYLLACLTSGVVVAILLVGLAELSSSTRVVRAGRVFGDMAGLTMFTVPTILTLTFLPTVPFVWWSEKRAERRLAAHAGAGIAMAIAGSVVFFWGAADNGLRDLPVLAIPFIPAGFVAGATYWLVSGRYAGAGVAPQEPASGSENA